MKTHYTYSLIRYVHDVVTGEFVNVGVVLYAPEIPYTAALCSERLERVSCLFRDADLKDLKRVLSFIRQRIDEKGKDLSAEIRFNRSPDDADELLRSIMPRDDSAVQYVRAGGGVTTDLSETLHSLYSRYVEHSRKAPSPRRGDRAIWNIFEGAFKKRNVLECLHDHTIEAPGIRHTFAHAWNNERWHCYQPLSFDMPEARRIEEKATQWLGRSMALSRSNDHFILYYLLGAPRDPDLIAAFENAKTLLRESPVEYQLIPESASEEFARQVAQEIAEHR